MGLEKRSIMLLSEEVVIDPADLLFDDRTLNQFFERVSGRIDYIGRCHADAQCITLKKEQEYKQLFLAKFKFYRIGTDGGTKLAEKTAEMLAKADVDVQKAESVWINARHNKDLLHAHLQALNAARGDASQRGHFIRKEMDKLHRDIYEPSNDDINAVTGEIG